MRIKSLTYRDNIITNPVIIENYLNKNGLTWLTLAEIENAIIEIKDNKLYWHSGVWYYGDWKQGIWLDGMFRFGTWHNGVWHNGVFKNGTWKDGIFMNGTFENGTFEGGEWRGGIRKGGDFKVETEEVNEKVIKFSKFF
jgi:hypothetical protein